MTLFNRFACIVCISILLVMPSMHVKSAEWIYIVAEGDNLWNLSRKYLKNIEYFKQLQTLNQITQPKKLQPGSLIRVPLEWIKENPAQAQVAAYSGTSSYTRSGITNPIKLGTQLLLGDELSVDDASSVTVVFADGSQSVIYQSSSVVFDHLSAYGETGMVDTRLRVNAGKIETKAAKSKGPGSRLDIRVGTAISSVRGTEYRVGKVDSAVALVEVLEGIVSVDAANQSLALEAGFASKITPGSAPSLPIPLLDAPVWERQNEQIDAANTWVNWQAVDGAASYKLVIAADKTLRDVTAQLTVLPPQAALPSLDDDTYFMKLTAIDSQGIEGKPAYNQIHVNAFPLAPHLDVNSVFVGQSGMLTWQKVLGASAYQLEILSKQDDKKVVITQQIMGNYYQIDRSLPYGEYHWRVAGVDKKGNGPFSKIGSLTWLPNLPTPKITMVNGDEAVSVFLPVIADTEKLVIQLASDSEFNSLVEQSVSTSSVFKLNNTIKGVRYVRCRIESQSSAAIGQWSNVLKVEQ